MKEISYNDTDKKIEVSIYGLVFEIKSKIEEKDLKEMEDNKNNQEKVEEYINKLLGDEAVDKINEKRKKDGYDKIDLLVGMNILGLIFSVYADEIGAGVLDSMTKSATNINNKYNSFNKQFNNRNNRGFYNNRRRY